MFSKKNVQKNLKKLELIDFSNKFHLKNLHLFPVLKSIDIGFSLEKNLKNIEEDKFLKNIEKFFCGLYFFYSVVPYVKYKKNELLVKKKENVDTTKVLLKLSFFDKKKLLDFLFSFFFQQRQENFNKSLNFFMKKKFLMINKNFISSIYFFNDLTNLLNHLQIDLNLLDVKVKTQYTFKAKNMMYTKYAPFSFINF